MIVCINGVWNVASGKVSKWASGKVSKWEGKQVSKWRKFPITPLSSIFFLLLLSVACGGTAESSQTGYTVAPEFQAFYDQFGGERVFGEPITETFHETDDGPLLQYFQAVRMEYDPTTQAVAVFPLGAWELGGLNEQSPLPVDENLPSREFATTGQSVRGEFLAFYEAYEAEQWLGAPISPQLDVDGQIVQYFENGRLEYHPELPENEHIQVGSLGQAHFDAVMAFVYDRTIHAQPVPSAGLTRVDVSAYVKAPTLYEGQQQTLFVTVKTPAGRPVEQITATVVVSYEGYSTAIDLGQTDHEGRITAVLDIPLPPGQDIELEIEVLSADGDILGITMTTFKTWW